MRAVVQRVSRGSVSIDGKQVAQIGRGFVILVGVGQGDAEADAAWLADKIAFMRMFEDEAEKTNLSVLDVKGEAIVVSQFTLYADTSRGRRPGFSYAAPPDVAEPLVRRFAELLGGHGVPVQTGVFGADMLVEILNDGPVTILLDSPKPKTE
ncbi:MAG: D-tyrosyl-tRNA(Tyr) deacylase [Chloroflexi bacterium]|nr:D-tyrosyl-tRNA(Tyr) deacylase [Chloroflexota bacterium]MBI3761497.1 D-tyrosyl-tRNA(Tyr) deacylase [Chloroflexota bacterium]